MTGAASLPMYLRPETAKAYQTFWNAMRQTLLVAGIDAPEALAADGFGYAFWERPDLVLSQTCGYPFRKGLVGKVHLVGTPDYGLPDVAQGNYHSVFVVARDSRFQGVIDLDGAALAFNDTHSQSGYHGPIDYAASLGVTLYPAQETGAHRASMQAVLDQTAEVAALDAVTWRDCLQYDAGAAAGLRVIGQTHDVPGLPLICGLAFDPQLVRRAVDAALTGLDPRTRGVLGIKSIVPMTDADYEAAQFAP